MPVRTFQISSDIFWGFRTQIIVEPSSTQDSILHELHLGMTHFFTEANLLVLADRCRSCKLHLHEDIASMLSEGVSEETIFFACDHDH